MKAVIVMLHEREKRRETSPMRRIWSQLPSAAKRGVEPLSEARCDTCVWCSAWHLPRDTPLTFSTRLAWSNPRSLFRPNRMLSPSNR